MNNRKSGARGGCSAAGVIQIVFIVLKLTGLIGWSWAWVLAPLWIALSICFVAFIAALVMAARLHMEDTADDNEEEG